MKFFLCLILLSSSIALDLKYLIPVDQAKGFLLLSQEEVNALTAPAKQEIFEKTPSTLILNEKIRGQFEFDLWPPQKHQIPESWIRLPEGYASKDPLLIDLPESVQQIQINSLISPFQMLSGEQSMRLETGIYPIFSQPLNLSLASIETSTNYPLIEPEPLWEADHTLHLMASEISIDSKITISLPAGELTSLALGHFESKYLEKIELMPFQPLEIQGNRLRWAQPVRQNFEIHLFMRMPREDTMNVALPFVQATGVRNHLYVQPEEGIEFSGFSSGISTMASDRYDLAYDLQDQKEIVLRSRQLAFAPTAGPLIQDLKISTILSESGKLVHGIFLNFNPGKASEISFPFESPIQLLGVFLDGKPVRSYYDPSSPLRIDLGPVKNQSSCNLELKILSIHAIPQGEIKIKLPSSLLALTTDWEIQYPPSRQVDILGSSLENYPHSGKQDFTIPEDLETSLKILALVVLFVGGIVFGLRRLFGFLFHNWNLKRIFTVVFVGLIFLAGLLFLGILDRQETRYSAQSREFDKEEMNLASGKNIAPEMDRVFNKLESRSDDVLQEMASAPAAMQKDANYAPKSVMQHLSHRKQKLQAPRSWVKPIQFQMPTLNAKTSLSSGRALLDGPWVNLRISDREEYNPLLDLSYAFGFATLFVFCLYQGRLLLFFILSCLFVQTVSSHLLVLYTLVLVPLGFILFRVSLKAFLVLFLICPKQEALDLYKPWPQTTEGWLLPENQFKQSVSPSLPLSYLALASLDLLPLYAEGLIAVGMDIEPGTTEVLPLLTIVEGMQLTQVQAGVLLLKDKILHLKPEGGKTTTVRFTLPLKKEHDGLYTANCPLPRSSFKSLGYQSDKWRLKIREAYKTGSKFYFSPSQNLAQLRFESLDTELSTPQEMVKDSRAQARIEFSRMGPFLLKSLSLNAENTKHLFLPFQARENLKNLVLQTASGVLKEGEDYGLQKTASGLVLKVNSAQWQLSLDSVLPLTNILLLNPLPGIQQPQIDFVGSREGFQMEVLPEAKPYVDQEFSSGIRLRNFLSQTPVLHLRPQNLEEMAVLEFGLKNLRVDLEVEGEQSLQKISLQIHHPKEAYLPLNLSPDSQIVDLKMDQKEIRAVRRGDGKDDLLWIPVKRGKSQNLSLILRSKGLRFQMPDFGSSAENVFIHLSSRQQLKFTDKNWTKQRTEGSLFFASYEYKGFLANLSLEWTPVTKDAEMPFQIELLIQLASLVLLWSVLPRYLWWTGTLILLVAAFFPGPWLFFLALLLIAEFFRRDTQSMK